MTWRSRLAILLAPVLMTLGLSVATAAPAQALPTGCKTWIVSWQIAAYTTCTGGTGYMKTALVCKNGLGWSAYRESPWTSLYWQQAKATCPIGTNLSVPGTC